MIICTKIECHYLKNIDKRQISDFLSALKFLAQYSSQSQSSNFLRKSHKEIDWNNWKPKRNKKSIQRKNFEAPLHFALFWGKNGSKKGPINFFGILGFWTDVLDNLAKRIFFFLPKCGRNVVKIILFLLWGLFSLYSPPGYPGGQEVGFLTWFYLFYINLEDFHKKNWGWKFYRLKSLSDSDIIC